MKLKLPELAINCYAFYENVHGTNVSSNADLIAPILDEIYM